MGFFHYLNVGLIYVTVGFACAIYYVFLLKRQILGSFWGALVVGIIGSFSGGILHQLLGVGKTRKPVRAVAAKPRRPAAGIDR